MLSFSDKKEFFDKEKMIWVPLMPRDKAALILEAFDTENQDLFLILGDWMEDRGQCPEETQRFREGNWRQEDYDHAMVSMYWNKIEEFRNCSSVKVFIRLLKADKKFLEWISKSFFGWQKLAYDVATDPRLFESAYGETARLKLKKKFPKPTEKEFKEACDAGKEMCYLLKAKSDLKAWSDLWKDRRYYIDRPLSNWQRTFNINNTIPKYW